MENKSLTLFYDGECPFCTKEICWLQTKPNAASVIFVDISSPEFKPEAYNKTKDEFMRKIHAQCEDGSFIIGAEVFRRLYSVMGFRKTAKILSLPLISHLVDISYAFFACIRVPLGSLIKRIPYLK